MLNWCCVTTNIKMSGCFYCFYLSYSLHLNYISDRVDVFLFFDDLGIFDCISRACSGNIMYCHCTVNIFTASMNYWSDNERRMARHRGQKYLCEFVYNLCEFIHNLSLSKITSYNTFTTLLLALPLSASFTWLRTKCVQLVCQTNHLSIYSHNWCMAMFVLKEVFFRSIPSRVSKFVYTYH